MDYVTKISNQFTHNCNNKISSNKKLQLLAGIKYLWLRSDINLHVDSMM